MSSSPRPPPGSCWPPTGSCSTHRQPVMPGPASCSRTWSWCWPRSPSSSGRPSSPDLDLINEGLERRRRDVAPENSRAVRHEHNPRSPLMYGMLSGLALAVVMALGDHWVLPRLPHLDRSRWVWSDESVDPVPRDAWLRSDPADSIYRRAREIVESARLSHRRQPVCPDSRPIPQVRVCGGRSVLAGVCTVPAGGRPRPARGTCRAAPTAGAVPQGRHQGRRRQPGAASSG